MQSLDEIGPAFVEMAHRIVWASVATVDQHGRPRSRVLHPIWEWDGESLTGWIATSPTPIKRQDLAASPFVSVNYWAADHDTCLAECAAEWILDDAGRTEVWNRFADTPEPVGYDPSLIPPWTSPTADAFAGLKLTPYRVRLMDGSTMLAGAGRLLRWQA